MVRATLSVIIFVLLLVCGGGMTPASASWPAQTQQPTPASDGLLIEGRTEALAVGGASLAAVAPAATVATEGFEGVWPGPGYQLIDASTNDGGEYLWGQRDCTPHEGSFAAMAAGGGAAGGGRACGSSYPNNARTWAIYGPFDLSTAVSATLTFHFRGASEVNTDCTYDYLFVGSSIDGDYFSSSQTFCGTFTNGTAGNGYYRRVLDLASRLGQPQVWVGFLFHSDGTVVREGFTVDDVTLSVDDGTVPVTYSISGKVTASGGPPLAGAEVTAVGPQTVTTTTANDGSYTLQVGAGQYVIQASAAGFSGAQVSGVSVPPSRAGVDLSLSPLALPDLVVQSMAIELETGSQCYTSATLGVRVTVANTGAAAAGPFAVETNGARQTVSAGLGAGQTASLWFSGYQAGANTATVDPDGQVSESKEGNNARSEQLPIPTLPLPCASVTATPTSTATATPTSTTVNVPPLGPVLIPLVIRQLPPPTATPTAIPTATPTSAPPGETGSVWQVSVVDAFQVARLTCRQGINTITITPKPGYALFIANLRLRNTQPATVSSSSIAVIDGGGTRSEVFAPEFGGSYCPSTFVTQYSPGEHDDTFAFAVSENMLAQPFSLQFADAPPVSFTVRRQ